MNSLAASSIRSQNRDEIIVTEHMVSAGLNEIRRHQFDADLPYVVECVFRSMAYPSLEASSTICSK